LGAAWTTVASYVAMALLSVLLGQRHYPVPYNVARLAIYVGGAAVLGWVAALYSMTSLWPSLLCAGMMLAIVLYAERDLLRRKTTST